MVGLQCRCICLENISAMEEYKVNKDKTKKVPISLIVDDPAPVVSVYHAHSDTGMTKDGRPLIPHVSNDFLRSFCDITERHGIKGKFSVVPMPGNQGDIVNGIHGVDNSQVEEWLCMVKERLMPGFTVGPEMLTHNNAVDIKTGKELEQKEDKWAAAQDRTTLTPYITRALSLLKEVGIHAFGVTSPWSFAIEVEDEYTAAISQAVYEVSGRTEAWYFLQSLLDVANARPWISYEQDGRTVVSIPATVQEHIWQTIDTTETSDAYICSVADELITEDGKEGEIIRVLECGGYPILLTHWQSLVSNGLGTGMKVLDEVGRRINKNLSDRVTWMSFEEILQMVIEEKEAYRVLK